MRVYIAAGHHQIAYTLAHKLELPPAQWSYLINGRALRGIGDVVIIEETDTFRDHDSYFEINQMIRTVISSGQGIRIRISLDAVSGVPISMRRLS